MSRPTPTSPAQTIRTQTLVAKQAANARLAKALKANLARRKKSKGAG